MRISDWSSDVCSSDLPDVLDRVLRGRIPAGGARSFGQRIAVPMDAEFRRQDRPAHRGETAREESGIGADDMMVRLEPGDEARGSRVLEVIRRVETWPDEMPEQPGERSPLHAANRAEREQRGLQGEHRRGRSEEHTSELQSLMRISYAVS